MTMKILIAEDESVSALVLEKTLREWGHFVARVADGKAALLRLQQERFSLVISNWMMPEMDGLQLCQRVRARSIRHYVYVILLTAKEGREDRTAGYEAGADDFLTKPFHRDELYARLKVAERILTMQDQIESRSRLLERMHADMEHKNLLLAEMATTDELTGLKNQRCFTESLQGHFSFARQQDLPLSLLMLDVDRFKDYNDTHGHLAGDDVLRRVARTLQETIREHDIVARYGGEEFIVLLPGTDSVGGQTVAERMRNAVEHQHWTMRPVTVSIGVATLTALTPDTTNLIYQADQALDDAKRQGRNRIVHSLGFEQDEEQILPCAA